MCVKIDFIKLIMYRKLYIILILSGLVSQDILNAQWIKENSPSTSNLNSIHFGKSKSGWIVGDNGVMLYNLDNYWVEYKKITDENLKSVFMLEDNKSGWAVGSNGTILRFDGKQWEKFTSPTNKSLYSVSFLDPANGIAVGAMGTVITYENGCWSLLDKKIVGNLYTVSGKNDYAIIGGGFECNNVPIMKIEINAGKDITNTFNPFIAIRSLTQIDQNEIWAVGTRGNIFHFNGNAWIADEFNGQLPSLLSISFSDKNNGITVGFNGTILVHSVEGWEKHISPVSTHLRGATISGDKYYAIGEGGTIISLQRNSDTSLDSGKKSLAKLNIVTYPNPSDNKLNIIIPAIGVSPAKELVITDFYGKIVFRKKIDADFEEYSFSINTTSLNNGMYFIQANSNKDEIASGKFLIKH